MNARKRVVLLTRPGHARERTETAIAAAGADVAAVLDPATATEADVRGAAPDAVLVILDPAVEHALQKFDGVLGDPALEIMFEDADVAARREGWEAARWARHLGAKLYGHDDVLPRAKGSPPVADPNQLGRIVREDTGADVVIKVDNDGDSNTIELTIAVLGVANVDDVVVALR